MEYKPLSGREFPRFSAIKSFFRLPVVDYKEDFDIAIMGTPFDGAVSYRPGSRFAPSRVREASSLGRGYHWTRSVNWSESLNVADIGDCPVVPISIDQTYQNIESYTSKVIATGKKLISVGGDHSTTLPLLRAFHKKFGTLRLLHFDAHLDTYPAAWGCEYHHGAFVRHAVNEALIDPKQSHQFGIRGPLAAGADLDFVNQHGIHVHTVDDIRKQGIMEFVKTLPHFDQLPTFISFDVDCLDPAYAPGTGTPVPGGLSTYEVQQILRSFVIDNFVGGDVVEILPAYDPSEITCLAGVDVLFEYLCLMARK